MAVGDRLEVVQYQGEAYQAVEADGFYMGCESEVCLCGSSSNKCCSTARADGKDVIWVKLEKEQPVVEFDTIKEIRAKMLGLTVIVTQTIEGEN
jgi:hypothetical protein